MRKLIITVHGIRTFGQWQERLEGLVRKREPEAIFEHYHYGYFSVISFIIPMFRWLATLTFRKQLLKLVDMYPDAEVTIVSHSFGTHLVGWGLLGIDPKKRPRIKNVILAGSVLKSGFPWGTLLDSKAVDRVINDCGIDDEILILSQFCVLFTGMAGRLGFTGMTGTRFSNRYFSGGHSHYFGRDGKYADEFMERYWVPLIAGGGGIEQIDERQSLGVMQGVKTTFLQIADPVKLLIYVGAFWLLLDFSFISPYRHQVEVAKNALAKAELEALLQSDTRSKIDKVRAALFDEKVLPAPMQSVVISKLEWLAGEYLGMEFDRAIVNPDGRAFLDDYVRMLEKSGSLRPIVIFARVGRYCLDSNQEYQQAAPEMNISKCKGDGQSRAYSQKLSVRRAESVKAYLVSKGVESNRIHTEGAGDIPVIPYPKAGVASDWNRVARLNSRIEVSEVTKP